MRTPPTFRLRRLHKQRRQRTKPPSILCDSELASALGCSEVMLEVTLERRGIPYHKDTSGRVWSSEISLVER